MLLNEITPMILTFNEEANLQRTLDGLKWARNILLVDSFSEDRTLEIAACYPQVKVIQRKFDHFADQCNFGLQHIDTEWTLSLDADYVCSDKLPDELSELDDSPTGFEADFRYCIYGYPLRATLYPARTVLYRTRLGSYARDGHAHRVKVDGPLGRLKSRIDHDDHKPLSVWLKAQARYASQEADKLLSASTHGWKDRLRRTAVLAPALTLAYCLIWKGLWMDGRPGLFYTAQRVYAELLLSLELADRRLRRRVDTVAQESVQEG